MMFCEIGSLFQMKQAFFQSITWDYLIGHDFFDRYTELEICQIGTD